MSFKYGLNLREPQKKQPAKATIPKALGFGDDDDNENDVGKDIYRQAYKNKSLKDIEEQRRKALEDPSVFDYDGVYDEMKEKAVQSKMQECQERKFVSSHFKSPEKRFGISLGVKDNLAKDCQNISKICLIRQKNDSRSMRLYMRENSLKRGKEDHLYADKDKFVRSAYKKKLAEQAKWMEEERLRQFREEKEDVTKKTDRSDFYFNLGQNVAFGAQVAESSRIKKQAELRKQEMQAETKKPDNQSEIRSPEKDKDDGSPSEALDQKGSSNLPSSPSESPTLREGHQGETSTAEGSIGPNLKPVSGEALLESSVIDQSAVSQPNPNHHKRGEDAISAAKERFLARKKAIEQ